MKLRLLLIAGLIVSGCASLMYGRPQAAVDLQNAKGEVIGSASFWEDSSGVKIAAQVKGAPPGVHGFHIHAVGKCEPPAFTTASGHFNPGGKKHGMKSQDGPHAGDLPNIIVGADGGGRIEFTTRLVSLGTGPTSLFDADGSALVLHADPDDEKSDPTGNAGGRIGCGVIRKAS